MIWVFHSVNSRFPGGVFTSKEKAEVWIAANKLTGMLTAYPPDQGVYDHAIESGAFKPVKEEHFTSGFIGGFTSASQEHYHYENGVID